MTKLDDQLAALTSALSDIGGEVTKVSADTTNLLSQLANIPTAGLTPEQQASLDAAVATATEIQTRLAALDALVPEPETPAA